MNQNNQIYLKSVSKNDLKFLYKLLTERDPRANISHKEMPSYEEHVKFVLLKPYTKWYVILLDGDKIGSIYLSKKDEIGIFLSKNIQGKGIGNCAINLLEKKNPRKRYLANVNPKNKNSSKFFKKNGFKLIQHTYELKKETKVN